MKEHDNVTIYNHNASFWVKKQPRVMGDLLARRTMSEIILTSIVGRTPTSILEAGCGTGYLARRFKDTIERSGRKARITGIDISEGMIEEALKDGSGIDYRVADIQDTGLPSEAYDIITSVGVLIHNAPQAVEQSFREAHRLLKPEGVYIVSITHPFLYVNGSPAREGKAGWLRFTPISTADTYAQSAPFKEEYKDVDGNTFTSTVWHHPLNRILQWADLSGLSLIEMHEQTVEKEHLLHPSWGTETGYPAYMQLVFDNL